MVYRRCPQCGATGDDQYGFCIKCGWEFPKIDPTKKLCPLCGYDNPEEADFCVKCGTPLMFVNTPPNNTIGPIVIKKEVVGKPESGTSGFLKWLIIFGYLFSILGGLRFNHCNLSCYKKRSESQETWNHPIGHLRILYCYSCSIICNRKHSRRCPYKLSAINPGKHHSPLREDTLQ